MFKWLHHTKHLKKLGIALGVSLIATPAFAQSQNSTFLADHPLFAKVVAKPVIAVWKPIRWLGNKTYIWPATKCSIAAGVKLGQLAEPAQPLFNLVVTGANAATTFGTWVRR